MQNRFIALNEMAMRGGGTSGIKINTIYFVFRSVCTTLAIAEVTFARKRKEKLVFLLLFAHIIVTLHTEKETSI